jgi:hypothetical protein
VLAGGTAGLALWTKNEGLVLLAVMVLVRVIGLRSLNLPMILRRSMPFLAGLAPPLLTLIYFKIRFAPGNDMVAGQSLQAVLARFTSPSRYLTVTRAFASQARSFGNWIIPIFLVLAFYAFLTGLNSFNKDRGSAQWKPLATALAAAVAYFAIYVATPHQLQWHLKYSLDRVLMQVWPSAIFGIFLLLNTMEDFVKAPEC